ncbi:NnrU family protein [Aquimonas voraii]|uniref:Uncharacterized membrane protein n=1 Tax=Aquimonas voraii TaxID=265719 RepID=A0A1G6RUN3_9GAMM|nr:NnrU family protein [Aquimonas voraii]SDD07687.1 Uncharacterized membrane protein [Aquimonas voraii]
MTVLLAGLLLFLGVHSLHALAPTLRSGLIERLGAGVYKGLYSLISVAGFALIVYGYSLARAEPVLMWSPPVWIRHLVALFTLPAFILLVAAYVPGNHFKAKLGHPMLLGVKLWAAGHLLAVGWLHGIVLLAGFLAWAVIAFAAARRRDRSAGVVRVPGSVVRSALCVIVGSLLWGVFALHLHLKLIGVAPFA